MADTSRSSAKRWIVAIIIAAIGVTWQYSALSLIERYVTNYPTVPDVVMDNLPRVDFGIFGEIWFFGLILLFAIPHFRRNWRRTPDVLIALGLMYFIRGWIMFLFPIGAPTSAVGAAERLSVWGYESHAYFPGGHIAILTILTLFTTSQKIRAALRIGLVMFGVGTILSKNHYTADSIVGVMLGVLCAVLVLGRLRIDQTSKVA